MLPDNLRCMAWVELDGEGGVMRVCLPVDEDGPSEEARRWLATLDEVGCPVSTARAERRDGSEDRQGERTVGFEDSDGDRGSQRERAKRLLIRAGEGLKWIGGALFVVGVVMLIWSGRSIAAGSDDHWTAIYGHWLLMLGAFAFMAGRTPPLLHYPSGRAAGLAEQEADVEVSPNVYGLRSYDGRGRPLDDDSRASTGEEPSAARSIVGVDFEPCIGGPDGGTEPEAVSMRIGAYTLNELRAVFEVGFPLSSQLCVVMGGVGFVAGMAFLLAVRDASGLAVLMILTGWGIGAWGGLFWTFGAWFRKDPLSLFRAPPRDG